DILTQDALRQVIRKVIGEVAQTGLPGEHHFFVTFETRHPGVRISSRLRAQYPEEMTIVLQHQFWDLNVTETTFEVGLSFNGVP
ncbi:ClpXP protease specificity-enhancing factor SspB, partial [Rhodoplanes serenus]